MLKVQDTYLRVMLLSHIAAGLKCSDPEALRAVGIDNHQLCRLQELRIVDLHRLARMRTPLLGVTVDTEALRMGLRALSVSRELKDIEDYFIRNGASWRLMKSLFSMRHKLTLALRREYGVHRGDGRQRLPNMAERERIWRAWEALGPLHLRDRYLKLHGSFPNLPIEALEIVVAEYESHAL